MEDHEEMNAGTDATCAREQAQEGAREPALAQEIFITVSDALEYLFCPRFIFFMHCLGICRERSGATRFRKAGSCTEPGESEPGLCEK
jgi:hypothetical protein